MNILQTNPHPKPIITGNLRPKYPRGWGEGSLHPDLIPYILFHPGLVIHRVVLLKMNLVPSRKEVLSPVEDLLFAALSARTRKGPMIAHNRQVAPPRRLSARK